MIQLNDLYCIDNLEGMSLIEDKSIDLIITSPPYNIGVKYNVYQDNMSIWNYLEQINLVFIDCHRILKDNGSIYLNLGYTSKYPLFPFSIIQEIVGSPRFQLQNVINWVKSISINDEPLVGHYKPVNSERYHHISHEFIFHITKTGNVKIDKEASGVPYADKSNISRWNKENDVHDRGNVWFIPYETKQRKGYHPSTYPERLVELCILDSGIKEGLVFDPYVGIGTTAVVAKKMGLQYLGFDIDPFYIEKGREALHNL